MGPRNEVSRDRRAGSGSRCRGFTLLELIVVVCIVGVLAAIAFTKMRTYQELAEKAAMEQTLSVMASSLRFRAAYLLVGGQASSVGTLETTNPIDGLQTPPRGYSSAAGEAKAKADPGSWYFDPDLKEIVYVPVLTEHLRISKAGEDRLRFKVKVDYDRQKTDEVLANQPKFVGIRLVPVVPYEWYPKTED